MLIRLPMKTMKNIHKKRITQKKTTVSKIDIDVIKKYATPKVIKVIIILPIIFLVIFLGFLYFKNMRQSTIDLPKTPQTKEILRKLSVFMILPNETPIFATVQNTDSLAENPFYKNARVARLYRPSTDKIIDFTTIALKVNASNPAKQTTKPIAKPTSRKKPTT